MLNWPNLKFITPTRQWELTANRQWELTANRQCMQPLVRDALFGLGEVGDKMAYERGSTISNRDRM